jgi:VanZ family protein
MSSSEPGQSRRGRRYWISAWMPVLFCACVISVESTAAFGADHTTGPLRHIWEWIFGVIADDRWEIFHHLIRKTGHFIGYGLIGLAWLRAWWMTFPRGSFLQHASLAFMGTAFIASCDEFHQSFLPNRTGTPYDVLLDCTGATILMCVTWLILRVGAPKRLARAA